MQITIYTDGACDIHAPNRPGGWAAILHASDDNGALLKETVISGGAVNTTNNQMELRAVIEGIKALERHVKLTVVSDSRYVIDIARGAKKAKANQALWREFHELTARQYIQWRYVEGHAGDPLNERCDKLAVAERSKRALKNPQTQAAPLPDTPFAIYLSTRYQRKSRSTGWGAVIVWDGETREMNGCLADTSELEGSLISAIAALRSLPADAD
ncbi:MAG: ribonuclease HI, partial [Chloroflexi bacterium]|nr:ribonuclease HI [Chloroflexota bacterium]